MARSRPIPEDFFKFMEQFMDETDRAIVVLAGSYLEEVLDQTVRTWLVPGARERFFITTANKLDLAHALGILNDDEHSDLDHVFKIRHHFAHHVLDAKWDADAVKNNWQFKVLSSDFGKRFTFEMPGRTWQRVEYLKVVFLLALTLKASRSKTASPITRLLLAQHAPVDDPSRLLRVLLGDEDSDA